MKFSFKRHSRKQVSAKYLLNPYFAKVNTRKKYAQ